MRNVILRHVVDFEGWRAAARSLALQDIPPDFVLWSIEEASDLFAETADTGPLSGGFSVPRSLVELAETVVQANDPERFSLLYRLIWRAHRGEKHILEDAADPLVQRLTRLAQAVRRDTHKMRAFVRFREVVPTALDLDRSISPPATGGFTPWTPTGVPPASLIGSAPMRDPGGAPVGVQGAKPPPAGGNAEGSTSNAVDISAEGRVRYVAWFEPEHYIVEANAPFFVRRFATMHWSILTPYRSAHWDGEKLLLGAGATKAEVPDDDALEAYWRAYFSSIFNPARLKVAAMTSEMPRKYWRNLPEAAAIPELIRQSRERTESMVQTPKISPERAARPRALAVPVPTGGVAALRHGAAGCQRCDLFAHATQTVFGEGPPDARVMLVGEQPGDQEDLAGRPFVGPAGQMLDRALLDAGIARETVYITNAVKHFKFEPRGKRRIHATPNSAEIEICRFWLDQERALLQPAVIVLLGASAARAVLGRAVTISRERGRPIAMDGATAMLTTHPSYLLRIPDEASKQREYAAMVRDLRAAHALLEQ